jgi:hypothetical protein
MKRSKPLVRRTPLQSNTPLERRTPLRRAPLQRATSTPQPRAKRRNDSRWRAECIQLRGARCRGCGDTKDVQMHHVLPRAHGGESVVENGQPMCGPWTAVGPPGGCHAALTEHRMCNRREWLDDDQLTWLKERGWVWWDDEGVPHGRGSRGFERTDPASGS